MDIDRNAAPIVLNRHTIVRVDRHPDVRADSRHGFVYAIVHDFIDEVVQSLHTRATDIHGWALAYGFEAFKHADTTGVIGIHRVSLSLRR